ncbi:hypothetical protein ACFWIB_14525 [Streptomyces sp. NPDC127051]|uniref:hypothetical protein n=1 Tax=Streptomyces sp. NPDC127051 TaxID=3347119 RepID=UPI00364A4AA2
MTAPMAERQAARRAELAAALRPQPRHSAWTAEQQHQHRTDLEHALDGTEWHQPIPNPHHARHYADLAAAIRQPAKRRPETTRKAR